MPPPKETIGSFHQKMVQKNCQGDIPLTNKGQSRKMRISKAAHLGTSIRQTNWLEYDLYPLFTLFINELIFMSTLTLPAPFLLRLPKDDESPPPDGQSIPAEAPETENQEDPAICCKQCLQKITHPSERIAIQGAHQHVFANAYGIVFEIGCFRTVWGCRFFGPATDEWTWFGGYKWRIASCSQCGIHLGWQYTSTSESKTTFHGLILGHLILPS
jgi:hypothetical protein